VGPAEEKEEEEREQGLEGKRDEGFVRGGIGLFGSSFGVIDEIGGLFPILI